MENPLLRLNGTATERSNKTSIDINKHQQNKHQQNIRGENNMSIKVIFQTARCITFEIQDGSIFESQKNVRDLCKWKIL